MEETVKTHRLSKVASEFNISIVHVVDFLAKKGHKIDNNPNQKLSPEMYDLLCKEFQSEKQVKETSKKLDIGISSRMESVTSEKPKEIEKELDFEIDKELIIKNTKISYAPEEPVVEKPKPKKKPEEKTVEDAKKTEDVPEQKIKEEKKTKKTSEPEISSDATGPKVIGQIDLEKINDKKPKKKTAEEKKKTKTVKEKDSESEKEVSSDIQNDIDEIVTDEIIDIEAYDGVSDQTTELIDDKIADEIESEESDADIEPEKQKENFLATNYTKLDGPKILGRIDLPVAKEPAPKKQPVASSSDSSAINKKKKRKRLLTDTPEGKTDHKSGAHGDRHDIKDKPFAKKTAHKAPQRQEPTEEEIQKQIRETLARLSGPTKSKASKYRRQKRDAVAQQMEEAHIKTEEGKKILQLTEFVTVNELSKLLGVSVNDIISTCMTLGLFVSINQRLDAEVLAIVAEEFGYKTEFVSTEIADNLIDEADDPKSLEDRTPIVTVMGHVDHGKTSLLDYIRNANVIAGEAGGITQHIGAYEVTLENGKKITFLDTPGHEAFTAMRARGAKVTDIAIIVIAADDSVMPQTIEAINHAQAAKVPLIFAINKMDKTGANPEKIKEALANMNLLVEDWGGNYQCQEISAKKGLNIDKLLEKVLLESEMLELKANPKRNAVGTILESSLEKGRGYVAKLLIQNGTMKIGDMVLAGYSFGRVKAMYNERNQPINTAGPATPVLLLGLNGAPQAGDAFNVLSDEREAKEIANKRFQLQREQSIRTHKHITLDEIGRRIAIGDFKELNIIIKGDVDGSVEALSDSLLKLSTPEIQVNVIQKLVGQITETDVMLASASNAIIIGFQVRPSLAARKLAEQEQIDIRLYSIIYTAINELKSAIEGMLSPEIEEKIVCNLEVREVFKITKVGTIAGCFALDGKINRNTLVRIIRDGIVVYEGKLGSLKRFKDDVKEVFAGQECGLNIENFNDIKVGDIIEGYEQTEVKRKLD